MEEELVPVPAVAILLVVVGIGFPPFFEAISICSCIDKVLIKL
jgi:hypothetical protein